MTSWAVDDAGVVRLPGGRMLQDGRNPVSEEDLPYWRDRVEAARRLLEE
mgnify:CR=1 FL=1